MADWPPSNQFTRSPKSFPYFPGHLPHWLGHWSGVGLTNSQVLLCATVGFSLAAAYATCSHGSLRFFDMGSWASGHSKTAFGVQLQSVGSPLGTIRWWDVCHLHGHSLGPELFPVLGQRFRCLGCELMGRVTCRDARFGCFGSCPCLARRSLALGHRLGLLAFEDATSCCDHCTSLFVLKQLHIQKISKDYKSVRNNQNIQKPYFTSMATMVPKV